MRGLIAHAVLAVAGLLLAFFVWTGDEAGEGTPGEVTVWDCNADEVTAVALHLERADVKLERRGEGDDAYWWITHERRAEKGEPTASEFTGSEQVDEYLEGLAPLRAVRELGKVDEETLKDVGLADTQGADGELAITCGGKERTFALGDTAFGSGDRYFRDARGGGVYLVDANVVRDLQSAPIRLMQRKLGAFEWRDVARLEVSGYDQDKTLLQRNRRQPRKAQWVDEAEPDRRNELYGNWLTRVRRLSVREYLGPEEEPGGEGVDVQPIATLGFLDGDGDALGRWELVRAVSDEAVEYYARGDATRSWVRLPRSVAKEVAHDVRPVLGLEAVDESEPPKPPEPEEPSDAAAAEEAQPDGGAASGPEGAQPAPESGAGRAGAEAERPEPRSGQAAE